MNLIKVGVHAVMDAGTIVAVFMVVAVTHELTWAYPIYISFTNCFILASIYFICFIPFYFLSHLIQEIVFPDKTKLILYLASSYAAAVPIAILYRIEAHYIHDFFSKTLMHPRHAITMLACMVAVPFGSYFLLKLIARRRAKA